MPGAVDDPCICICHTNLIIIFFNGEEDLQHDDCVMGLKTLSITSHTTRLGLGISALQTTSDPSQEDGTNKAGDAQEEFTEKNLLS